MPDLEIYEPDFEEISDPNSSYYDPNWFESERLPDDHEWYEIIGDFLFMRAMIGKHEYTGKNDKLAEKQKINFKHFNTLIPEIEGLIRDGVQGLEFSEKWAKFCSAYDATDFIKREEETRKSRGKHDRGTMQRRAWFATVYLKEKTKRKTGAVIKRDIAKFAELIKAKKIESPTLWNELHFEKILSGDSKLESPLLNYNLQNEMNIKEDIPHYAEQIAPRFLLPPFEIKTSV